MSSLAGFRGFPGAPAYCASKAAVRLWGEALRGMLGREGIEVSVICHGYVKSRMTEKNDFPMPFLMTAERAAAIRLRGPAAKRASIVFTGRTFEPAWMLARQPPGARPSGGWGQRGSDRVGRGGGRVTKKKKEEKK